MPVSPKSLPLVVCLVSLILGAVAHGATPWHTSFGYESGGVWLTRLPINVENRGSVDYVGHVLPVDIPNLDPADVPNIGLRLVREDGQEVTFGIGKIERDDLNKTVLFVPLDVPAGKTVRYYLYSNNPKQRRDRFRVPEYEMLELRPEIMNGGFETMDGSQLEDWVLDPDIDGHELSISETGARSGRRCFQTTIREGIRVQTVAARQSQIALRPGVKYRLSGYVKGENVRGGIGLFLHITQARKILRQEWTPQLRENLSDWQPVSVEFTAPEAAERATVATIFFGTGTAWYDDIRLEEIDRSGETLHVQVGSTESCPLKILPEDDNFISTRLGNAASFPDGYECRSTFRIVNDSDIPLEKTSMLFDLRSSLAHGRIGMPVDIIVQNVDKKIVPGVLVDPVHRIVGATLETIPPQSVNYVHIYYRTDEESDLFQSVADHLVLQGGEASAHPDLQKKEDSYAGLPNLLSNGGFEDGGPNRPSQWYGVGVIETDPAIVPFGNRCLRIELKGQQPGVWRGESQRVSVEGGRSYLISGWLRSKDLTGAARLNVHFHDSAGNLCSDGMVALTETEVDGTSDWKCCSQRIIAPKTAASMVVYLSSDQLGTLWYDNIRVIDSLFADFADVYSIPPTENQSAAPLLVWQVPAVMKVFPQSLPPSDAKVAARITTARNEKEPLQLAVRGRTMPKNLQIVVSPLQDGKGNTLEPPEAFTVGYVPIDRPSGVFIDHGPQWHRRAPHGKNGTDGWQGRWPDPLIPGDTMRDDFINENETNAFWLTWSIPKAAVPGTYKGTISFASRDFPAASLPKLPLEVVVYEFALPDQSQLSVTYDTMLHGPKRIWQPDPYRRMVDVMRENRLSPELVVPDPDVKYENGRFVFDWQEFDQVAARLIEELKVRYLYVPYVFRAFDWGHPPKDFFGSKPYEGTWPYADADRSQLREEYVQKYQAALREFWDHIKAKGWADNFVLFISDEPNSWEPPIKAQMIALCKMIHEVDPTIPIYSSTWAYVPEWTDSIDIWGLGHYGIVTPSTMEAILKQGKRLWFTTDCLFCLDTPYCSGERLMPYYCFQYGAEAYEFWGIAAVTTNPWYSGFPSFFPQSSRPGEHRWLRALCGDGYLLYPDMPKQGIMPGRQGMITSVRFEQVREGIEDYEYFRLLQRLIEKAEKSSPSDSKLEPARTALAEALEIVRCPTPTGRFSTHVTPDPRRIEVLREKVARAIESFKP